MEVILIYKQYFNSCIFKGFCHAYASKTCTYYNDSRKCFFIFHLDMPLLFTARVRHAEITSNIALIPLKIKLKPY